MDADLQTIATELERAMEGEAPLAPLSADHDALRAAMVRLFDGRDGEAFAALGRITLSLLARREQCNVAAVMATRAIARAASGATRTR